jgi:hypothetical protein
MSKSYAEQLLLERAEQRKNTRTILEAYLKNTPPTFEECYAHLAKNGVRLSRTDYENLCRKLGRKPRYESSPAEDALQRD